MYVFSYCDYNYKYSEGCRLYSKHVASYLKKRPRDLVLTCLSRFESAKNVGKAGIVQVVQSLAILIMLHATGCHLEMTKIYHIAHVVHGKSHITHANIFSLYFWSFQIGLGMHYLRCMSILPIFNLTLCKGKRMFCCWRFITLVAQCWKYWKRRKSSWWSTAKRKRARWWKRRTW